jgi:hypothetical protein
MIDNRLKEGNSLGEINNDFQPRESPVSLAAKKKTWTCGILFITTLRSIGFHIRLQGPTLACTGTDQMHQCRIVAQGLVVLDSRPVPS